MQLAFRTGVAEERDAVARRDRNRRESDFVYQIQPEELPGQRRTADEPDGLVRFSEVAREIAYVTGEGLDPVVRARELPPGRDVRRRVAVRPAVLRGDESVQTRRDVQRNLVLAHYRSSVRYAAIPYCCRTRYQR